MKKKPMKVKQQEPEPELAPEPAQNQTPLLQGFSRKIFYPSFKISNPYDLKFAHKYDIHFKRTRVTEDFNSPSYKRLIKRNLKYIKQSEVCTFGSRPSLSLLQEVNQHERNHKHFPTMAEKQKRKVALGLFGHRGGRPIEERDMICLFRFLCKNNISMKSLKLFYHVANNQHYQKKYMKYLTGITSLEIEHNGYLEGKEKVKNPNPNPNLRGLFQRDKYPDIELDQVYHQALEFFGKLKRISLDYTRQDSENVKKQSFLCDVIKMLSQIPTLKAIEITMILLEAEKKPQKLKAFTEKLTELKSLKLNLSLSSQLKNQAKVFTTLLPLPTLRHLSINLQGSNMSMNCADLADFIGSFKNLETFEFKCLNLLFEEYLKIFQAIQKLKSLTKLSVAQVTRSDKSFAFGTVFKTLSTLKKLTSIKIDLAYRFDDNELNSYPQHLLKHPALKRAKIALQVSPLDFNLKDEFFANIHRLRDKLDKFHLTLVYFPVEVEREIKKIIIRNQKDLKHFNCQIVGLSPHLQRHYFGAANQVNNQDDEDEEENEEFDDDYEEK